MLKEIGTEARKEIVRTIKRKVYLELYVTVEPNWRSSDLGVKKQAMSNLLEGLVLKEQKYQEDSKIAYILTNDGLKVI